MKNHNIFVNEEVRPEGRLRMGFGRAAIKPLWVKVFDI
jgi:hypothetical protein